MATPKVRGAQAHSSANPAEFGFDKPAVQITFTAAEKPKEGEVGVGEKEITKERTLIIGKAVERKPEDYAKLAENPAVFKLAAATKIKADKPTLHWLHR